MTRKGYSLAGALVLLSLMLSACHGGLQTQTFVNDANPTQQLELSQNPSLKARLINTVHGGPERGKYTLKSDQGGTVGTYVLAEGTLTIRPPDGAKAWTATIQKDSSLRDEKGNLWRPKTVVVEKSLHSWGN